jgi:hypothetical protein
MLFKQNSFKDTCVKDSKALNVPKHYIIHTMPILFFPILTKTKTVQQFFFVKFPNIKFQGNLFSNSGVKYEQTNGHSIFYMHCSDIDMPESSGTQQLCKHTLYHSPAIHLKQLPNRCKNP